MKKPCFLERIRICGGWDLAPTTTDTVLFSGQGGFTSPCSRCDPNWAGVDGSPERVGLHSGKGPLILPDRETQREGAKVVGFRFPMGGLSTRWLTTLFVVPILSGNNRLQ